MSTHSTQIFLNTNDSSTPDSPSDAYFNLNLGLNEELTSYIRLDRVTFANTVYPIRSVNNSIVFTEGGGDLTATITADRIYTGSQIATEIATQMTSAGGDTYTGSYDSNTKKITISSDGTFNITSSTTCLRELGWVAFSTAVSSYTSAYPVRLDSTSYVDIIGNFTSRNISSNGYSNILARVVVDQNFGTNIHYVNYSQDMLPLNSYELDSFHLRLQDDQGRLFTLPPNSPVNYVFTLSN